MEQTPQVYISQPDSSKSKNWLSKIKKIIFVVVILLVFIVSIGAVFGNLSNIQNFIKVNLTSKLADYQTTQTQFSETDSSIGSDAFAKLTLTGPEEVLLGSELTVEIMLSSDSKIRGTDAVILYDPTMLTNPAVKAGSIFDNYPFNYSDQSKGRIFISGIKTDKEGFAGEGLFGSITFTALKKGHTSIKFQFTKGQTVDSNVLQISTGADLLTEVSNLEILVK